jgi:hypothetical protein
MTGSSKYSTLGDPDYVNIIPDDQFLDRYVFFIDYTYSDSTLTVVRRKNASGLHDVTLDCLGKVTGSTYCAPMGEAAWYPTHTS